MTSVPCSVLMVDVWGSCSLRRILLHCFSIVCRLSGFRRCVLLICIVRGGVCLICRPGPVGCRVILRHLLLSACRLSRIRLCFPGRRRHQRLHRCLLLPASSCQKNGRRHSGHPNDRHCDHQEQDPFIRHVSRILELVIVFLLEHILFECIFRFVKCILLVQIQKLV